MAEKTEQTTEKPKEKYVFIAGGIGITPFRSILLDLAFKKSLNEIILLYANSNQEIAFKDELDKLVKENPNLKIHYIIDPDRITLDLIKEFVPNFSDFIFFISGTKSMVNAMKKNLLELNIKKKKIKSDYFPGYE